MTPVRSIVAGELRRGEEVLDRRGEACRRRRGRSRRRRAGADRRARRPGGTWLARPSDRLPPRGPGDKKPVCVSGDATSRPVGLSQGSSSRASRSDRRRQAGLRRDAGQDETLNQMRLPGPAGSGSQPHVAGHGRDDREAAPAGGVEAGLVGAGLRRAGVGHADLESRRATRRTCSDDRRQPVHHGVGDDLAERELRDRDGVGRAGRDRARWTRGTRAPRGCCAGPR